MPTSPAAAPLAAFAADLPTSPSPPIAPALVWLMAITCGLVVANLYYNQPLLVEISTTFGVTESRASLVATATQVGYTLGLLFLVPLGDKLEQKRLILLQLLGAIGCLVVVATAPTFGLVLLGSLLLGIFCSVPQLLLPLAAHLANDRERGRVVGTVMSGLLIGILVSRTISGYVGAQFGWRAMFWAGAAVMVVLGAVLALCCPATSRPLRAATAACCARWRASRAGSRCCAARRWWARACSGASACSGPRSCSSSKAPPTATTATRPACLAWWAPPARWPPRWPAGRPDRRGADYALGLGILLFMGAYLLLAASGYYLIGLIVGVVILDVGQQITHISNQSRVFALLPEARSRLNTVYMTACFAGASLGSYTGGLAWGGLRLGGRVRGRAGVRGAAFLFNRFYGTA